jgi:hypothetical protein
MGTWSLAGNALGNPPEGVLGTTDNNTLIIETAGKERLRIDPSGNVGIGTTNQPPQISLFTDTFRVQSPNMWLSLTGNGGGQLRIANNPNDNRVWLEAYSADASASATEMLLTGFAGGPVPALTLLADTFRVQSSQMWLSLASNGGGQLRIASNANDNRVWLEAYSADASASATEMLLTGFAGEPVPQLTLQATNTTVTGKLTAGEIASPTISSLAQQIGLLATQVQALQAELLSLKR